VSRLGWLAYDCVRLVLGAAAEGVDDLVRGRLCGGLGLVNAAFVLEAIVPGENAGGFLCAAVALSMCLSLMSLLRAGG